MQHNWNVAAAAADRSAALAARSEVSDAAQPDDRHEQWHDSITGLPRPRDFLERLERVLAAPGRPSESVAMLVLRITDFDVLTVSIGKPCCDEALRIIAERLHEAAPDPSLVTRLCGGNFAIVLHGLGPEVTAEALATRLLERASEPCPSGDRLLTCVLVGALALRRERQETALTLLERAARILARANLRSAGDRHHGLGLD